jgi:hypothetical protein
MADKFCIVAGIVVPVAVGQAAMRTRRRGKSEPAYDNTLRSTIDPNGKRELTVTTIPMDPVDVATLRAAAPDGSRKACTGRAWGTDGINSPALPVTCVVEYGDAPFHPQRPKLVRQVLTLTLREV